MRGASIAIACVALGCGVANAQEGASSTLSPPSLTLTVAPPAAGGGGGPWKLRIENTGDVPVRIAADPRLLVLEVTPPIGTILDPTPKRAATPKAPVPVTVSCALPADARPASDEGHDLVIPGKRSWSQIIDPLFYCFGPRERRALVSGASVSAHFGWPVAATKAASAKAKKPAASPPFAASPVGAAVGRVAPAKELVSAPFALGEDVAFDAGRQPKAEGSSRGSGAPLEPGRPVLSVTMPESHDTGRGAEIGTSVTVTNDGDQAALLLFRPETLRFAVTGPQGSVTCGGDLTVDSPIRELYGSIGVKGHASLGLLLDAVCPPDTFDEPGIFRVTATLDTTSASARSIGLKTWDGESTAKTPMLLRVRSPRRAASATARPTLD